MDDDREAFGFATTTANEFDASFSPDGKHLAYVSDKTGSNEIYIGPVEGSGEKVPVSPGGGVSPRWSPDGDELFYLRPGGANASATGSGATMMAVSIELEPTVRTRGAPSPLFAGDFDLYFDVVTDGPHFVPGDTRFVMLTLERPDLTRLIVSLNWAATLRQAQ